MISLIAAMAKNRVIGKDGKMPWHIPSELRQFRQLTMGKTLLMGRKTFEAIGGPLKGRKIIVLSGSGGGSQEGDAVTICHSLPQALLLIKQDEELMVAGGESLYRQTVSLAQRIYLTVLDREYEGDAYFPLFDAKEYRVLSNYMVAGVPERSLPGYTCLCYERW